MKTVYPSHSIYYSEPDNFIESDRGLFYDCNFRNTIDSIEIREFPNVTVVNNLVFQHTQMHHQYTKHQKPSQKTYFKSLLKKYWLHHDSIKEAYLGVQEWNFNYFHWMTEVLPALLALHQFKNKKMPVLLYSSNQNCNHIKDTLELFGFSTYYYDLKKVVKVNNLFTIKVPTVGFYNEPYLLNMRSFFYKKFNLTDFVVPPFRKIYISRNKAIRRKVDNEQELEYLLDSFGFQTLFLEDYTIEEQVKLFYETKIVVACHGAGLTNVLFMQPEATVIELKAQNNDYWCFFSLARLSHLQYSYLLCESDQQDHRDANITVDANHLKKIINNYL